MFPTFTGFGGDKRQPEIRLRSQEGYLKIDLHDVHVVVTLNYWLSKFLMEVAKKSGERRISTENSLRNNLRYPTHDWRKKNRIVQTR